MMSTEQEPSAKPAATPPDEPEAPPVQEDTLGDIRRGQAPFTPFAVIGGVAVMVACVAGLIILVVILIYLL